MGFILSGGRGCGRQFVEVQKPAQASGRNVMPDVPEASARTMAKPAGRDVDLEHDDILDAPAVAPNRVQDGPAGLAGSMKPNDGKAAAALATEQAALKDARQIAAGCGMAQFH